MLTVTLQKHRHMLKRFLDESGENRAGNYPCGYGGDLKKKTGKFLDKFDHIHRKNVMIENLGLC